VRIKLEPEQKLDVVTGGATENVYPGYKELLCETDVKKGVIINCSSYVQPSSQKRLPSIEVILTGTVRADSWNDGNSITAMNCWYPWASETSLHFANSQLVKWLQGRDGIFRDGMSQNKLREVLSSIQVPGYFIAREGHRYHRDCATLVRPLFNRTAVMKHLKG
jgi:hypothetical protein